jgi:Outer membrane protein
VFPRFGYSIGLHLQGSAQPLLSSTSFFQTELVGKYIFSPTKYSRVIARGDLGVTSVGNIDNIPLSLQFFAGGSDSIRGYAYEELGPGRYLITSSLELQHQVIPKWYGAAFVDTGNAVNSFTNPQKDVVGPKQPNIVLSDILKTSVGVGVVWVSPVGPMELTFAKPVTDPGKAIRIQFTMGTGL